MNSLKFSFRRLILGLAKGVARMWTREDEFNLRPPYFLINGTYLECSTGSSSHYQCEHLKFEKVTTNNFTNKIN